MFRLAPWKVASILALVVFAALMIVPSFLAPGTVAAVEGRLPSFVPFRAIVLGLDLQGGAHLLMEVDSASVTKAQVDALRDDVRGKMREGKISISGGIAMQPRGVVVRIADAAERERALELLLPLNQNVGGALTGATGHSLDISDTGDGAIQLQLTDAAITDKIRHAVTQSIEVLNRRLNGTGTKETNVEQQGARPHPGRSAGPAGHHEGEGPARRDRQARIPPRRRSRRSAERGRDPAACSRAAARSAVQKRVMVAGEDLVDAQPSFDSRTGEPDVNFRFNLRGGQRFGQVTSENVGRLFAIVLDGKVISAPRILGPITGGTGQITGNFTVEEADNLAVLLRAGALPAKLTVVEERTVGPGLGQDFDRRGQARGAGRRRAGRRLHADDLRRLRHFRRSRARRCTSCFIFASMALLGATLTLPGIAGIVFTIGMAVDSNVLIYERIREEAHLGRSVISALDAGFKRAFATIIDSNVTMFVAAVILYLFGSGAVRGFAVSLGLGILTSVITAVTMTRMMIALWYRNRRPSVLPI